MGEIRRLTTDEGWNRAIPVLQQLWTDESADAIREWRSEDDYRLFGLFGDGETPERPVAVAGVSIQRVLHHTRHAWIHDFVVDEPHREEGHGSELLAWLEDWARQQECEYLALALRKGNDAADEFYRSNGLDAWGTVVETALEEK